MADPLERADGSMEERAIIDTHTHLFMEPLSGSVDGVLSRAAACGVDTVIVPAYDNVSWPQVMALADRHRRVAYAALGLHPWVADEPFDRDELVRRLGLCGAVAVGEIGLDTKIENADLPGQLELLETQIAIALELDLPVILHCRGAFHELRDLIAGFGGRVRGVLHAWSRGPELAREFLDLGLYLGFGGAVTRSRAKRARRAALSVPLDRILLETDAPSIGLDGVDPDQTEPRHVADIAVALAQLREESLETIAGETSRNARRLFRLPTS